MPTEKQPRQLSLQERIAAAEETLANARNRGLPQATLASIEKAIARLLALRQPRPPERAQPSVPPAPTDLTALPEAMRHDLGRGSRGRPPLIATLHGDGHLGVVHNAILAGSNIRDIVETLALSGIRVSPNALSTMVGEYYPQQAAAFAEKAHPPKTTIDKERFRKLYYEDGLNTAQVARELGVPVATLYQWKRDQRLPDSNASRITPDIVAEGLSLMARGMTRAEAAEYLVREYNVSSRIKQELTFARQAQQRQAAQSPQAPPASPEPLAEGDAGQIENATGNQPADHDEGQAARLRATQRKQAEEAGAIWPIYDTPWKDYVGLQAAATSITEPAGTNGNALDDTLSQPGATFLDVFSGAAAARGVKAAHPNVGKLVTVELHDTRTDEQRAIDAAQGIIVIEGDVNDPQTWERIKHELPDGATVITARPKGALTDVVGTDTDVICGLLTNINAVLQPGGISVVELPVEPEWLEPTASQIAQSTGSHVDVVALPDHVRNRYRKDLGLRGRYVVTTKPQERPELSPLYGAHIEEVEMGGNQRGVSVQTAPGTNLDSEEARQRVVELSGVSTEDVAAVEYMPYPGQDGGLFVVTIKNPLQSSSDAPRPAPPPQPPGDGGGGDDDGDGGKAAEKEKQRNLKREGLRAFRHAIDHISNIDSIDPKECGETPAERAHYRDVHQQVVRATVRVPGVLETMSAAMRQELYDLLDGDLGRPTDEHGNLLPPDDPGEPPANPPPPPSDDPDPGKPSGTDGDDEGESSAAPTEPEEPDDGSGGQGSGSKTEHMNDILDRVARGQETSEDVAELTAQWWTAGYDAARDAIVFSRTSPDGQIEQVSVFSETPVDAYDFSDSPPLPSPPNSTSTTAPEDTTDSPRAEVEPEEEPTKSWWRRMADGYNTWQAARESDRKEWINNQVQLGTEEAGSGTFNSATGGTNIASPPSGPGLVESIAAAITNHVSEVHQRNEIWETTGARTNDEVDAALAAQAAGQPLPDFHERNASEAEAAKNQIATNAQNERNERQETAAERRNQRAADAAAARATQTETANQKAAQEIGRNHPDLVAQALQRLTNGETYTTIARDISEERRERDSGQEAAATARAGNTNGAYTNGISSNQAPANDQSHQNGARDSTDGDNNSKAGIAMQVLGGLVALFDQATRSEPKRKRSNVPPPPASPPAPRSTGSTHSTPGAGQTNGAGNHPAESQIGIPIVAVPQPLLPLDQQTMQKTYAIARSIGEVVYQSGTSDERQIFAQAEAAGEQGNFADPSIQEVIRMYSRYSQPADTTSGLADLLNIPSDQPQPAPPVPKRIPGPHDDDFGF